MADTPNVISALAFRDRMEISLNSNTVYAVGGFGASLDFEKNLTRYTKSGYNKEHADEIRAAAAKGNCFAFDCICWLKSVGWWDWYGDPSKLYGGAVYKKNGMPDCSVHAMIRDYCSDHTTIKSTTKDVPFLAFLYMTDWSHIAVSLSNGIAMEATRYGKNPGVRLVRIDGLPCPLPSSSRPKETRKFDRFARCDYIDYSNVLQCLDAENRKYYFAKDLASDWRFPATVTQFKF